VAGIAPTEVIIIGAGAVGEYAARAAMGLGAVCKKFSTTMCIRCARCKQVCRGACLLLLSLPMRFSKNLKNADVVIGALHGTRGRTPVVVTEEMVSEMRHRLRYC